MALVITTLRPKNVVFPTMLFQRDASKHFISYYFYGIKNPGHCPGILFGKRVFRRFKIDLSHNEIFAFLVFRPIDNA